MISRNNSLTNCRVNSLSWQRDSNLFDAHCCVNPPIQQTRCHTGLLLPWKEKFREIAYHERRKENDLSLEAFRNYLQLKGHKVD